MPRAPTITAEEVSAICEKLFREGTDVSYTRVRAELGKGTYQVIRRYIEAWQTNRSSFAGNMPAEINEIITSLYAKLLAQARIEVNLKLEADYQSLRNERAAIEHLQVEIQQRADMADKKLLEVNHKESMFLILDAQKQQRIEELQQLLKDAQQELKTLNKLYSSTQQEVARLQGTLEAEQVRYTEGLRRAEERERGLEKAILQRLDAEKSDLIREKDRLKAKLNDHSLEVETMRVRSNGLLAELNQTKGRLEQANEQIAALQRQLARV